MRTSFVIAASALAALALVPKTARAQAVAEGFSVNRFEPSERGSDWFTNESLDLRGSLRPAVGVVGDYQYRPLVIYRNDEAYRSVVRNQLNLHAGASVVLFERLRLGATLPVVAFTDGHAGTVGGTFYPSPPKEQAIGDLRLGADVRLLGTYGDPFTVALGAQVWLPTGDKDQYTTDGKVRVGPRAMVAGDVGIFAYSARVGFLYRGREAAFDGGQVGSEITFGAAAGARVLDKKLLLGPELAASSVAVNGGFFEKRSTPVEALLGAHYKVGSFQVGAGAGTGFSRGFGSPEVRVLASLEFFPEVVLDSDGDGVPDKEDACPSVKGERTADPKTNGCPPPPPPPPDRDRDGILDHDDACPDVPGIPTGDPKTHGCPPPQDRDQDGILDKDDACPDQKGLASTDPTFHGCPDTDGDGVFDKVDACPAEPGLKTSDPKTNGCPDPDRDKDGIPNAADACPDEPGPADTDPKKNGCPKAAVKGGQIVILDQVKFKTSSADILPGKDSEDILQAVLKVMKDHPEIKKVRVEGHTDNRGQAAFNKKLSADRAASVVKWLVKNGVDKARLTSAGFGPDKPLADNETEDGRYKNRRVEFHIEP
ncbi:MAG: OmpA family protein [Myxococcales bacterium]|nr:OmpA family protein [Myxococcales bacterium]